MTIASLKDTYKSAINRKEFIAETLSSDDAAAAANLINKTIQSGALKKPYHLKPRTEEDIKSDINNGYHLIGIKSSERDLHPPHAKRLIGCLTLSCYEGELRGNEEKQYFVMMRSVCINQNFSGLNLSSDMIDLGLDTAYKDGKAVVCAKVAQDNWSSIKIFENKQFIKRSEGVDTFIHPDGTTEQYSYFIMAHIFPPRLWAPKLDTNNNNNSGMNISPT